MKPNETLARRRLLKQAPAALASAIALPSFIPATVLGMGRATAPSDRVTVACIGVGSRGTSVLRSFLRQPDAQLVAMCDVNEDNLSRAIHLANERHGNRECQGYTSFQEVLDRPDIDAVMIAPPHQWHVTMGVAAAKAGKDMYMEKPMALAMSWAWDLADAVDRYGVLFQFGTQQRSDSRFRYTAELARSGKLGDIEKILVLMPGSGRPNPITQPEPTPAFLDLQAWQGPALAAPYIGQPNTGDRSDRSFGSMSEWGPHMLDMVGWAGVHRPESGLRLEGIARWSTEGGVMDCPTQYSVDFHYGAGVEVELRSGGLMPGFWRTRYFADPHVDRRFEHANVLIGNKGWVYVDRLSINAKPLDLLDGLERKTDESSTLRHVRDFLDCVKSREKPVAPMEAALNGELLTHLAYIAVETGEQLRWDTEGRRFASSDAANRMLHRAMRSPWRS
jgi:predicted dehydrogenase